MRVRISTTIDRERLDEARRRTGNRDSELIDRALHALLEALDAEAEVRALANAPYDADPDLRMPDVAASPDIYDGDVPVEVLRLARQRRLSRVAGE